MSDVYLTIKEKSVGEYKEKGSKFIAISYQVNDENDVKDILGELRKEYHDARHHCYAYCFGVNGENYKTNDDGEPNHSAGDPILGQIRSKNLTNTLVVVVRYFGGTKLGIGGLISAYKTAAKEALDNAEIIEKHWTKTLKFKINYDEYSNVMSAIKEFDTSIIVEKYTGNEVEFEINVRNSFHNAFIEKINLNSSENLI